MRIKQHKFRVGVDVIIGHTGGKLCFVVVVLNCLAKRGPTPGPLFWCEDDLSLMRQRLIPSMQKAMQKIGIDCSKYFGHSFWIGTATTAATLDIQDLLIKTMGH